LSLRGCRLQLKRKKKRPPLFRPKPPPRPLASIVPQIAFRPRLAERKILEGNVLLEITVSEKGRPSDIAVLSDPGNGFAREAVDAVKHWKFKPAISKDGTKISTRFEIQVVSRQM
jgi:TonB family protein